jgi:2-iminobutanoate/2-iminopropanoate deaminase
MSAEARHRPVQSGKLPKPEGPYSPGVILDKLVFVAGQAAIDPATGQLSGPDIEGQTEQTLKNIAGILEAAGSGLQYVLRCGVFLADVGEFARMNAVYGKMFGENRPARTTVQAVLPRPDLRVEIDAIAYIP